MLFGLGQFIDEALKMGNVKEISMDRGILILQRKKEYPIAWILISTRSSRSLIHALNDFTERFIEEYSQFFTESQFKNSNLFEDASKLVLECFPFIPEYN